MAHGEGFSSAPAAAVQPPQPPVAAGGDDDAALDAAMLEATIGVEQAYEQDLAVQHVAGVQAAEQAERDDDPYMEIVREATSALSGLQYLAVSLVNHYF